MTELPFEMEMYRAAGSWAVWESDLPVRAMSPNDIVNLATDAAVRVDRQRMATIIRERVLVTDVAGLPPEVAMEVQRVLFDLADQVESGMMH